MSPQRKRHVVLVGMMGAGKSAVAAAVAASTGREAVDLDDEIVAVTGCLIADLFEHEGEERFREVEAAVLGEVLERPGPLVVATGGGAVLRDGNRRAMREHGQVVWLRADPLTLASRIGEDPSRPLLAGGSLAALERISAERATAYAEVADEIVDVDAIGVDEVADAVTGGARP